MQENETTELVCGGLNIAELSDEELFAQLQSFGIPVGPIVGKTIFHTHANSKSDVTLILHRNNPVGLSKEIGCYITKRKHGRS